MIEFARVSTSISPLRAVRLTLSPVMFTAAASSANTSRPVLRSVIDPAALTSTSPAVASALVPIFTSSMSTFPAAVVSETPFDCASVVDCTRSTVSVFPLATRIEPSVLTTLLSVTALNSSIAVVVADCELIEFARVSRSISPPRAVRFTLSAVMFTAAAFSANTSKPVLRSVIDAAAFTTTSPAVASALVPIFTSSMSTFPAAVVSDTPFACASVVDCTRSTVSVFPLATRIEPFVLTTLFSVTALNSSIAVVVADCELIEFARVSTSISPPRAVRLTLSAVMFTAAAFSANTSRPALRSVIATAASIVTSPRFASPPVPIRTTSTSIFPPAVRSEIALF